MSNNKTCRGCRFHKNNRCMLPCHTINHPAENSACHRFEVKTPLTNGDVIRQISNEGLAEFLKDAADDIVNNNRSKDDVLTWLNAPEESEGKDEE